MASLQRNLCFILLFSHATGNFKSVTNSWSSGDKLSLEIPINLRTEAIDGILSIQSDIDVSLQCLDNKSLLCEYTQMIDLNMLPSKRSCLAPICWQPIVVVTGKSKPDRPILFQTG